MLCNMQAYRNIILPFCRVDLKFNKFIQLCIITNYPISIHIGFFAQAAPPITITIMPFLPNNQISTFYRELKLVARIEEVNSYTECYWHTVYRRIVIFDHSNSCENRSRSSCVKMNNVLQSTLLFPKRLAQYNNTNKFEV